ncbi:MAG TPA: hypothetical protein O0X27_06785 [Methanocorpusculum sp.]|nr:hypothetical protein [Methanocorpusculum sp.]
MKSKSKAILTVLLCCGLALAFTVSAGCTSINPILGTWKCDQSVDTVTYITYYDFNANRTCIFTMQFDDQATQSDNLGWEKVENNHYQTGDGSIEFYLNSDGTEMRCVWDGDSGTHYEDVYVRVSSSEVQ